MKLWIQMLRNVNAELLRLNPAAQKHQRQNSGEKDSEKMRKISFSEAFHQVTLYTSMMGILASWMLEKNWVDSLQALESCRVPNFVTDRQGQKFCGGTVTSLRSISSI